MSSTSFIRAALLLALAVPTAAQAQRGTIVGFGELEWGDSRQEVERYWRETPHTEHTERGMTFMQFQDWEGMQWSVGVHERDGFAQLFARSLTSTPAAECPRVFAQHVARMRRQYARLAETGGESNPGGGNLCEAVRAGRATARYEWQDPVNGARATVYVDPGDGRVVYSEESGAFRQWRAQGPVAYAQVAPAPSGAAPQSAAQAPPAMPPAGQPAVFGGYDSRLWNPGERAVQIPFGAPRREIERVFGEPLLEDTRRVGPGMVELMYTQGGQGLVFTVHNTRGLIRANNSTGLVGPDVPCNQFWERMRNRVAAMFPGATPRGGAHNPRGGDLCEEVQAGRAFAEVVWPTADGGTVWLRIGPETGVISVAVSSREYHQWFDTSPEGRERFERVRRAAAGR
ncbi:MAG TPA: hypothetical protein VHG08_03475 [Longimicrobium sp.]|nr:hypothetical protein [Longimicrobium sp.]